jgi:four helix bundle protein
MEQRSSGVMEETQYRNKNRGYQRFRVWNDAIELHVESCRVFRNFPHELKRVASQAMACAGSIQCNIGQGYCRRSIREYLNFLNISPGSQGESVSGLHAYRKAEQISEMNFEALNNLTCAKPSD